MPVTTDGSSATWTGTFPNGFVELVPGGAQWSTIVGGTATLPIRFSLIAAGAPTPLTSGSALLTVTFALAGGAQKPVGGRFAFAGDSENNGFLTITQNGGRLG